MLSMFGKKSISDEIKHLERDLTVLELHLIELQASKEAINRKISYLKNKEQTEVVLNSSEITFVNRM